jgi:hypothetical protein
VCQNKYFPSPEQEEIWYKNKVAVSENSQFHTNSFWPSRQQGGSHYADRLCKLQVPSLEAPHVSNKTLQSNDTDLVKFISKNKLRGLSPRTNYTDRATAACRRS